MIVIVFGGWGETSSGDEEKSFVWLCSLSEFIPMLITLIHSVHINMDKAAVFTQHTTLLLTLCIRREIQPSKQKDKGKKNEQNNATEHSYERCCLPGAWQCAGCATIIHTFLFKFLFPLHFGLSFTTVWVTFTIERILATAYFIEPPSGPPVIRRR